MGAVAAVEDCRLPVEFAYIHTNTHISEKYRQGQVYDRREGETYLKRPRPSDMYMDTHCGAKIFTGNTQRRLLWPHRALKTCTQGDEDEAFTHEIRRNTRNLPSTVLNIHG